MNRKKRTTTRDIAKACFVSQSAVSMILSGRKDIHFAPETIERVKRTAKEMGYEYKARAKRKKTGTNDTIMIMCPSLANDSGKLLLLGHRYRSHHKIPCLPPYSDNILPVLWSGLCMQ